MGTWCGQYVRQASYWQCQNPKLGKLKKKKGGGFEAHIAAKTEGISIFRLS